MHTIKQFSILILTITLFACSKGTKTDTENSDVKNIRDTCSSTDTVNIAKQPGMQSEITCPKCGHKKMETMPTEVCLIKYTCEKCGEEMKPKKGDCCVFCTHGTHKCPSMQ